MEKEKKQNKPEDKEFFMLMACIGIFAAGVAGMHYAETAGEKPYTVQNSEFLLEEAPEYTLYIGLNDKDEYCQLISTEEAKAIVDAICIQYVDGYTVMEARGAWADEKNILTQENTLVYYFREADEESLREIMNEVIEVLNQNTILLEKRTVSYTYYGEEESEKGGEADDENGK